MLAKRIIPTMLVRGRTLVKGERFNSWRSIGHALQAAKVHAARGVDELCILDISATAEGRGPDLDMVRELSEGCFIPITVGGGVRTLADIDALLRAGADKVCIGQAAWDDLSLLKRASDCFGSQAIVCCIEHTGALVGRTGFGVKVVLNDELKRCFDSPAQRAAVVAAAGAGEILLSSVERDAMMTGYDLYAVKSVSAAVSIPVIASGGCGSYDHMLEAFRAGADACAAGAFFAFTDATPKGAARFLAKQGLEMRV